MLVRSVFPAQRVLADRTVYDDFLGRLKSNVEALNVGDQLDEEITMGPMVRESDAIRVGDWIQEAVGGGARADHGR